MPELSTGEYSPSDTLANTLHVPFDAHTGSEQVASTSTRGAGSIETGSHSALLSNISKPIGWCR